MIQPPRALIGLGLIFPGLGQVFRGRWLDATLVLVGTLGPLLFSALLLTEAVNERRFYARRGPPLSVMDPAVLDDLSLLPAIAPEIQLLVALALAVHLLGAVAAFRAPAASVGPAVRSDRSDTAPRAPDG